MASQVLVDLIRAFQSKEKNESMAVLFDEEGFDLEVLRVLSSWTLQDHSRWREPKKPCPDGGAPTARAYAWMVSGMFIDYVAIAQAAGVAPAIARRVLGMLLGNRLIYADGQMAKVATAAMQAGASRRLRAAAKPKADNAKSERSPDPKTPAN